MLVRAMTRVRTQDRNADDDEAFRFWEFSRRFDRVRLEIAAQLDLGLTDLQALHVVDGLPRCTAGELARALDLTISGTTAVIDRLEERRLVTRQRHPLDRRSVQLLVTTAGRHAVKWSTDTIAERVDIMLQAMIRVSPDVEMGGAPQPVANAADGQVTSRASGSGT